MSSVRCASSRRFPQPWYFLVKVVVVTVTIGALPSAAFMEKILIAVGSTRRPKLNAVIQAVEAFASALAPGAEIEVRGFEVESGVSHTPSSCAELMRGARQRSEALAQLMPDGRKSRRYFVGLEGGLDVVQEASGQRVFLESWAYVSDGTRGHYGRSGAVELPEALAQEVLEKGIELSVAIDRFAGAAGIRDSQGAWGVLSGNLIDRQEAFRVAVVAAFAPFYNARMYRIAAVAR
jgi:inosine/xanthosine triphosphatase